MNSVNTKININQKKIIELLNYHYNDLMHGFYEMQSSFLSGVYAKYRNIESASIALCFAKTTHLAVLRQREKYMGANISLSNFFYNLKNTSVKERCQKISNIVKATNLPKETVRRKIIDLTNQKHLRTTKDNLYYFNYILKKKETHMKIITRDLSILSKFVYIVANKVDLNLTLKEIQIEIEKQFSFYRYHFLNCQLTWLRMWQSRLEDADLIFVAIQAIIPTLKFSDNRFNVQKMKISDLYKIVGKANDLYRFSESSINASSISEISGIPRVTCIRKLNKLVKLGLLTKNLKTKRYLVSQSTSKRTKFFLKKENVLLTVNSFSELLSIIINELLRKKQL